MRSRHWLAKTSMISLPEDSSEAISPRLQGKLRFPGNVKKKKKKGKLCTLVLTFH